MTGRAEQRRPREGGGWGDAAVSWDTWSPRRPEEAGRPLPESLGREPALRRLDFRPVNLAPDFGLQDWEGILLCRPACGPLSQRVLDGRTPRESRFHCGRGTRSHFSEEEGKWGFACGWGSGFEQTYLGG